MRISDWSSDVCSSDLVGGFCLHRGCIFDHRVILLIDLIPGDRTGEDRLQVGKPRSHADSGKSKLLASDRFQAGCKLKSEKPAKCKANRALAMTINILSLDFHVGAMAQHALDHGGDLGGRAALELGIDACRASFDMPVDQIGRAHV